MRSSRTGANQNRIATSASVANAPNTSTPRPPACRTPARGGGSDAAATAPPPARRWPPTTRRPARRPTARWRRGRTDALAMRAVAPGGGAEAARAGRRTARARRARSRPSRELDPPAEAGVRLAQAVAVEPAHADQPPGRSAAARQTPGRASMVASAKPGAPAAAARHSAGDSAARTADRTPSKRASGWRIRARWKIHEPIGASAVGRMSTWTNADRRRSARARRRRPERVAAEVVEHAGRDDDVGRLREREGVGGDEAAAQALLVGQALRGGHQRAVVVGADQLDVGPEPPCAASQRTTKPSPAAEIDDADRPAAGAAPRRRRPSARPRSRIMAPTRNSSWRRCSSRWDRTRTSSTRARSRMPSAPAQPAGDATGRARPGQPGEDAVEGDVAPLERGRIVVDDQVRELEAGVSRPWRHRRARRRRA